jgi:hypothetical protein
MVRLPPFEDGGEDVVDIKRVLKINRAALID